MIDLNLFNSFAPTDKTAKRSGKNVVIYTRVSDSSQEENTSLESQKKYCEDWAKRKGFTIVEYFGGTYESAKTDDRKEFNKMLSYIKRSKKVNCILVYSYDRFSRSGIRGATIANDLFQDYNIMTLAVSQEVDPSTPMGQLQQNMLFIFSQMDNEMRRDKTVTGMRELLRKGYCPYSIPKGYTNLHKGRAVDQNIVVNEDGKFIKKAFLWKANEGMRNVTIIQKLNNLGYKLNEKRLNEILKNPFYCGIIVSRMLPGEIIMGRHEALISHQLFLKVNEIVAEKCNHPVTHKKEDNNLPLKIFMKCQCGGSMTGYIVKKKHLYYYKCRVKGCCSNKSANKIHEQFQELMNLKINPDVQLLVEEGIRAIYAIIFKERMSEKQLLNTNRNELLKKIESLEERFAVGAINEQLFQKFHDKFQKELADIENEKASATTASQVTMKHCIHFADMICEDPWQLWNNGFVDQRSRLQLLLFPNGIRFSKKTDQLEAVKTSVFFQSKINHTAEAVPDSMDELKSLSHLTFDQINCSIREINEKFTFEYIAGKRPFENCSREFHQYLIRFLEDYCLLMVSAYLSDTRKRIDSPIS